MNGSEVMSPGMAMTFILSPFAVVVVLVVVFVFESISTISCRVFSSSDGWMSVIAMRVQPAFANAIAVAAPMSGFC